MCGTKGQEQPRFATNKHRAATRQVHRGMHKMKGEHRSRERAKGPRYQVEEAKKPKETNNFQSHVLTELRGCI